VGEGHADQDHRSSQHTDYLLGRHGGSGSLQTDLFLFMSV
jgi:hypothetical protein